MEIEQPVICARDEVASRARDVGRRPSIAFFASVVAHALILAALVFLLPQIERPHQWVLAYLVDLGESGGGAGRGVGGGDAAAGSPPAPAHEEASAAMPPKPPHAHPRAAHP